MDATSKRRVYEKVNTGKMKSTDDADGKKQTEKCLTEVGPSIIDKDGLGTDNSHATELSTSLNNVKFKNRSTDIEPALFHHWHTKLFNVFRIPMSK